MGDVLGAVVVALFGVRRWFRQWCHLGANFIPAELQIMMTTMMVNDNNDSNINNISMISTIIVIAMMMEWRYEDDVLLTAALVVTIA